MHLYLFVFCITNLNVMRLSLSMILKEFRSLSSSSLRKTFEVFVLQMSKNWLILLVKVTIKFDRTWNILVCECYGMKIYCIVIYLDFHSTKRALWLVDSRPLIKFKCTQPGYKCAVVARAPNTTARDQCMTK